MLRSYKTVLLASLVGSFAAVSVNEKAVAGDDTATLGVSADVETPVVPLSCSFGTIVPVTFDEDLPTNTGQFNIESDDGSITFQCNKDASGLTIEMVGGSDRTLTNSANDELGYRMVQPNGEGASATSTSNPWGTVAAAEALSTGATALTDKTFNVFASLDTNVDLTASTTYAEDVTVQINF